MSDVKLIAACLEHNPSAQFELYQRYSPKMLSVCYRYARNREDAEDMLQEAFIKVFTQLHQYKGLGAFEGWVRKVVVHTCINVIKKEKRHNETVDLIHASHLGSRTEMISGIMQAKQIIECIRLLPTGYRTVLNLYAIEGFSHAEIAQTLDIAESTSRSQFTRAKQMLEEILKSKQLWPKETNENEWLTLALNEAGSNNQY
jgi:RNA polymerase sigma factor (sigma-70 family)